MREVYDFDKNKNKKEAVFCEYQWEVFSDSKKT